jgi:hypothetical protein
LSSSPGIKGTGVKIHENIDLFIQTYKPVFSSKRLGAVCEMSRKCFKKTYYIVPDCKKMLPKIIAINGDSINTTCFVYTNPLGKRLANRFKSGFLLLMKLLLRICTWVTRYVPLELYMNSVNTLQIVFTGLTSSLLPVM